MPQHIGNAGTKAMVWAEHIALSLNPQVKRAKELEEFTERLRSLFDVGEPLDVTTRRQMEAFFGYDLEKVRIHHGHGAEKASRRLGARAFTLRGHIFGPRQNLDVSTREGLGLLAHELTHAVQQTQPHRLPQSSSGAERDSPQPVAEISSAAIVPSKGYSGAEMVLLAPAQNSSETTSPQQREAQAQASERLVMEGLADNRAKSPPAVNLEEVTDRVYRLMQYDLVLERERATRLGG